MKIRVSYLKSPARADTKFNGVKYRGLARVAGPDEAIDSRRRKPAAFFYASEILISIFLMRAMICNCGCSLVSISPIRCVSNRIRGLVFESISWRRCRGAAFLRGLRMGGDSTARSTIRAALGTRPECLTQPVGRVSRRRNPPLYYCL